jgi:hypothetical protein
MGLQLEQHNGCLLLSRDTDVPEDRRPRWPLIVILAALIATAAWWVLLAWVGDALIEHLW